MRKSFKRLIKLQTSAAEQLSILFVAILFGIFIISGHVSNAPNLIADHGHSSMATAQNDIDCSVACTGVSMQKSLPQTQPPLQDKEPAPPDFVVSAASYLLIAGLVIAIYGIKHTVKVPLYTLHESLII